MHRSEPCDPDLEPMSESSGEPVAELQLAAFGALVRGYSNSAHAMLDSAIACAERQVARSLENETARSNFLLFSSLVNKSLLFLMPFKSVEEVHPDIWPMISKVLDNPTKEFINRLVESKLNSQDTVSGRESVKLAQLLLTALFLSSFAQLQHLQDSDSVREACFAHKRLLAESFPSTISSSKPTSESLRLFGKMDDEETWKHWIFGGSAIPTLPRKPEQLDSSIQPISSGHNSNEPPVATIPKSADKSTSKSKSKDWNKIMKELDKEIQDDEETETLAAESSGSQDSLLSLLRSIYQRSDSDTRRAMLKSYETSQGTVLSTNWNEVSQADYTKSAK